MFYKNYLGAKADLDVKTDLNIMCQCCRVMKMANILLEFNNQDYFVQAM